MPLLEPLEVRPKAKIRKVSSNQSLSETTDTKHSYIKTLPFEILSLIFKAASITYAESGERDYIDVSETALPFILLKVCKHWARVAIRTRSLWTHVRVPDFSDCDHSYKTWARVQKLAAAWLSYSGPVPLHLVHFYPGRRPFGPLIDEEIDESFEGEPHLEFPKTDEDRDERARRWKEMEYEIQRRQQNVDCYARTFLEKFVDHEKRWRSLAIELDEELIEYFYDHVVRCSFFHDETEPCRGRGLNLQKLKIFFPRDEVPYPKHVMKLHKWIASLQRLERLELVESRLPFVKDHLDIIPFERLRVVKIAFASPTASVAALKVVKRCKVAEEIVVKAFNDYDFKSEADITPLVDTNAFFTLAKVARLKLSGVADPLNVLKRLVLPELEHLEVEIMYRLFRPTPIYRHDAEVLQALLQRSGCRLKHFTIRDRKFSDADRVKYEDICALHHVESTAVLRQDPDWVERYEPQREFYDSSEGSHH